MTRHGHGPVQGSYVDACQRRLARLRHRHEQGIRAGRALGNPSAPAGSLPHANDGLAAAGHSEQTRLSQESTSAFVTAPGAIVLNVKRP